MTMSMGGPLDLGAFTVAWWLRDAREERHL
jgi:hypothetical protein